MLAQLAFPVIIDLLLQRHDNIHQRCQSKQYLHLNRHAGTHSIPLSSVAALLIIMSTSCWHSHVQAFHVNLPWGLGPGGMQARSLTSEAQMIQAGHLVPISVCMLQ